MNPSFNTQFNTIVDALHTRSYLAINQDGSLQKVGILGLTWRALTAAVTKTNTFQDCDAARVGNKIVEFVRAYKDLFTPEQGQILIGELRDLKGRLRRNYYNIELNINAISDILSKSQQSSRL